MSELSNEEKELLNRCDEVMAEMKKWTQKERDAYVHNVLGWVKKVFQEITEAIGSSEGPQALIQAKKVASKYEKEFKKNKHEILVCMLYSIKDEYQRDMLPIFVTVVGMLG